MNEFTGTAYYRGLGVTVEDDAAARAYVRHHLWPRRSWSVFDSTVSGAQRHAELPNMDGIGYVPVQSSVVTAAEVVQTAMDVCCHPLLRMGYTLSSSCVLHWEHYRRTDASLVTGDRAVLCPVEFSLGADLVGESTQDVLSSHRLADPERWLLEPGYTLYLLTQWLAAVQRVHRGRMQIPYMGVECAGAQYDPARGGSFRDVPRWTVLSPVPNSGTLGRVHLDWNWCTRARPAQGVATARRCS